jgi:hypothetical protein
VHARIERSVEKKKIAVFKKGNILFFKKKRNCSFEILTMQRLTVEKFKK